MILAFLLTLQVVAQPTPSPVPADVPTDWGALPELPYATVPRLRGTYVRYVIDEVKSGRCTKPAEADGSFRIRVPLIVQLGANGIVKRMIPAAIGCPTVEQYTVGLVQNLTRDNLRVAAMQGDGWYRTAMNYTWK